MNLEQIEKTKKQIKKLKQERSTADENKKQELTAKILKLEDKLARDMEKTGRKF